MKNRWKALLLAAGLAIGCLGTGVAAEETKQAAAATEALTEAMSEAAAVSADASAADAPAGKYATNYERWKEAVASTLTRLSEMTDEELDEMMNGLDDDSAAIAANWSGVKKELGRFAGIASSEVKEENNFVIITSEVQYDGVPSKTTTIVTTTVDPRRSTFSMDWEIKYPLLKLVGEAALNTLLGLGTVFVVLLFLSFVIGQIHWVPDLLEKRKKKEPVKVQADVDEDEIEVEALLERPAAAGEVLTDDLELVAVISAAIAAAEQTDPEGFVVRSIRKAGRRSRMGI